MVEEKRKRVPKYKEVEDGYEYETIYVASDGKEFSFKSDAKEYEIELENRRLYEVCSLLKHANTADVDFSDAYLDYLPMDWYYISSEEDLENFRKWRKVGNDRNSVVEIPKDVNFVIGDWYSTSYEYGGDREDRYILVSLSSLKARIEEFLKRFEE